MEWNSKLRKKPLNLVAIKRFACQKLLDHRTETMTMYRSRRTHADKKKLPAELTKYENLCANKRRMSCTRPYVAHIVFVFLLVSVVSIGDPVRGYNRTHTQTAVSTLALPIPYKKKIFKCRWYCFYFFFYNECFCSFFLYFECFCLGCNWFTFNEWPSQTGGHINFVHNFSVFNCQQCCFIRARFQCFCFVFLVRYYAPHLWENSMSLTHFHDFKKKNFRIWKIQGNICAKYKIN